MSSPTHDDELNTTEVVHDPMLGSEQEDEADEGDVVMSDVTDDSSEEGEDDEEEKRRIRTFIVDQEEEEEEEEEEERSHRKRKKRRKKRHRRHDEDDEALEEEDLELLEENTGTSFKATHRLTRLRRRPESPPTPSSKRRIVESSEDDLDDDEGSHRVQDIRRIWDDERARDEDDEEGDMDDFIDDEEEEEGGAAMDEATREERRREKRREERRKRTRARPELVGIDANAWDEIHDVFGDGHEYDWALGDEDEGQEDEESYKTDMKYQDVFEPSEIQKWMLTEDDDLIRAQDIPERMQLATSSLSESSTLSFHTQLTESDLDGAAMWVTTRLSTRKTREFFTPEGQYSHLQGALVLAVTATLRFLFVEEFEVPYIWTHKRDYICHFDPKDIRSRTELLSNSELWRIYALGQKYRSLLERRKTLTFVYEKLKVKDEYFEEEVMPRTDSAEVVADATEWLSMRHKDQKPLEADFRFHDDEDVETARRRKMPSRISAYEVVKKSVVSKLAKGFGIEPHQVVLNFVASNHVHFVEDQELNPTVYAEQFADPDPSRALSSDELLRRARMILATELGKDPLLRNAMRKLFKDEARISVEPTERGIVKIDEHHHYFNFKYLCQKGIHDMLDSAQFLHILAAENEHLVIVSIFISPESKASFERRLNDAFSSDSFSDAARAWNLERSRVVSEVLEQYLIPAGVKWAREYIREEVEDYLANRCAGHLRKRIDVASYTTPAMQKGDTPSVLAASWGKGDPHKDAINLVFLDSAGRMREQTKIDNLHDPELVDEFNDLVARRKPNVIVIGGFSVATLKLAGLVKKHVGNAANFDQEAVGAWGSSNLSSAIPVIYVHDDVARMYQHSKRGSEEFGSLSTTARYCVGLARYAQSPLNEYAALGHDIVAISFEEDTQHLVPKEKLLAACERTLVDVTNKVGVDINRAVADGYYQHLLPFVCGLGPRKAQALIKKIGTMGGNLMNRDQFIKSGLLTTKIFLNAAGFLRILQDPETKHLKNRHDDDLAPDPLDNTRIHPEDYELARKMATDALELDEEDIHDEHPSHVVSLIMQDDENEKKLSELNLDEFAISLYEANRDQKRHTLNLIRDELLHPFAESREPFLLPGPWDVVTMLTGETPRTLRVGVIVSVLVQRIRPQSISVRLDSGIEGIINSEYLADHLPANNNDVVSKGQTIPAVVVDIKPSLEQDTFLVELSSRPTDVGEGDSQFRRIRPDDAWDHTRYEKDREVLARKKRAEVDRTRRVIKHPNFHNFNTAQAEAYLEKQQRGDVVIRPSSKGINHLAVTWKVDDGLYQHIDVTEPNADPTGQTVGGQLIVDSTHTYADLDELIVNHVQAMARRVEELMAHEKYKHGTEDDLHLFLKNYLAANPNKSMYGFTLNRKRPGHFSLCFLANKNSAVQTWPVRVAPEAYYLFDAAAVGVAELCDAFKVRHLHESQNLANTAGGKTPFGAGIRTPARPGTTPGHMSVRQLGRTPNPYSGATPAPFAGTTPMPGYGVPQTPYGYSTPRHPPNFPPQPAPVASRSIQQNAAGSSWARDAWR